MTKGRPKVIQPSRETEKIRRLKGIIGLLRKESPTPTELIKKTKFPPKTVYRYLEELAKLGLIDRKDGMIIWRENNIVFRSRHDYDVMLKHSERLLFTNTGPLVNLSCLCGFTDQGTDEDRRLRQEVEVANPEINELMQKYRCLRRHIETGYPKLNQLLKKYRKMMNDRGGLWPNPDKDIIVRKDEELGITEWENKELNDFTELLIGKIYREIYFAVKNGVPLQGSCDYCPSRKITIKETSSSAERN